MLELVFGTRTKIKLLRILAESENPMTRNELTSLSHSGIRSTYEQVEELIAIGVLKEIKNGRTRVALDPEFPFYDSLRELLLSSRDYLSTSRDVLQLIDRICGDNFYIGAFTAARQKIVPIDYDPPFYLVNILEKHYSRIYRRISALGKLSNVRVYEDMEDEDMGETGEITIFASACERIPPDVKRIDFLNVEVWIASVERGIIECLTGKTPFIGYGTYLALLQNRMDNVLDAVYFRKLAGEEGCLPLILAVMSGFNEASGKEIFEMTEEEKRIAETAEGMVDKKEIKHAINTVMG